METVGRSPGGKNNPERELPSIKGERVFAFAENGQEGNWLRITAEDGTCLEGAHFIPTGAKNGEVVIFHPGLPGDSVTWFEKRHMPHLLREGYEVFVGRHAGLIPAERNRAYIHNEHIERNGGVPARSVSIRDWLREPELSLRFFSGKPMTIITHSFGSLTAMHALAKLQERYGTLPHSPLGNLRKWLTLGGVTQDLKEGGMTDVSKGIGLPTWGRYFARLADAGIYKLENPEKALEEFMEGLRYSNASIKNIPKHIQVISVNTEGDSYVGLEAGLDLQKRLGRGLIIDDKTFDEHLFPEGIDPHDLPHMRPETLTRLVKMRVSSFPHKSEARAQAGALR